MNSKTFIHCFLIFLLLVITMEGKGAGQSISVDSLKKIAAKMPDNQAKADQLFQVSRNYLLMRIPQYDSALIYSNLLLDLSERIGYLAGVADGYYLNSLVYKSKKDFDTALDLNMKYIEIYIFTRIACGWQKVIFNWPVFTKRSMNWSFRRYIFIKAFHSVSF